ncbi:PepSY-associated TM helix domain-containing protein [Komagataeibacter europaeus]|uniref:PepSY-associated TM helix domain-containing protein n=1 Tax=Komagataeibacter europaeus TaxID=33995 RepID=UPI000B3E707D|nr:PepSY-associated TM helix domain-containing protein [Komagataeibacter europaeus]ARW15945.1 Vanillate monooxygenase [Komagataeibacter europaeus]
MMAVLTLKTVRPALVRLHRYTGLLLSGVLFIAGLTGSISVFRTEIDAALNPDLFHAPAPAHPLPVSALLARLKLQRPETQVTALLYRPPAGRAIVVYSSETVAGRTDPVENEIFLDPGTGRIQGMRPAEGCCFNRRVLMSFIYRVHYSLDLGQAGMWVMGISAMLWSIDCVVGLFLTFPLHQPAWRQAFWRQWRKTWAIGLRRSSIRITFDLHRAVSLWLWVVLLGIAISGVALALEDEVFNPVIRTILPTASPMTDTRLPAHPVTIDQAEGLAAGFVQAHGSGERPAAVLLDPDGGTAMFYLFSNQGTEPSGLGSPIVTVDLKTGQVTAGDMPGRGAAGNLVMQMQLPWHSGRIAGFAGRILICLSGLSVCMLVVTGIMIWQRKRQTRQAR